MFLKDYSDAGGKVELDVVGAVQVESSVTHSFKAAWFQPLNLYSENPVSKFAFTFNLYHYTLEMNTVMGAAVPALLYFISNNLNFIIIKELGGAGCCTS
jgi:hypothetical protein